MIELELVWISGILAGLFFFLNFATCYSMPWSKKCIGKEPVCKKHKPLAWLTILTGASHIIVAILWRLGF